MRVSFTGKPVPVCVVSFSSVSFHFEMQVKTTIQLYHTGYHHRHGTQNWSTSMQTIRPVLPQTRRQPATRSCMTEVINREIATGCSSSLCRISDFTKSKIDDRHGGRNGAVISHLSKFIQLVFPPNSNRFKFHILPIESALSRDLCFVIEWIRYFSTPIKWFGATRFISYSRCFIDHTNE